jgi:outer membrane protein TolC
MFSNNQSINNLLINKELSNIQTKIQESQNYPRIAIGAGGNYNLSNSTVNANTREGFKLDTSATIKSLNAFLNVTATYNIFDGGVRKRQIENAKLNEMVAGLQIDELKRTLSGQLENTLATFNNQRQLVLLTQNLIENAEENLRIADERFKGGLITSFDYRTIQLNFINASQARLNAIFNLKTTETDLIKLIGGLIR